MSDFFTIGRRHAGSKRVPLIINDNERTTVLPKGTGGNGKIWAFFHKADNTEDRKTARKGFKPTTLTDTLFGKLRPSSLFPRPMWIRKEHV